MKDDRKTLRKISASPGDRYIRVSSRLPSSPLTTAAHPWQRRAGLAVRAGRRSDSAPRSGAASPCKALPEAAPDPSRARAPYDLRTAPHTVGNPTRARYSRIP
ncbi:hypothetical protein P376_1804 [Streptomyces sp. HCCB10043]|uniref:Predicted protein n=1 Tax=Streptomyces filamentosus NRRL 15998 TaxID=457431 RepID=D6ASL8_STRFL|nr:predicted protein [Streptomyces filamentosus NRRL 15998]ESU50212.1 hypothetical protein P376_1804 [Streptomyces sp. HCCB10043]EWS91164.1 hypothetical protein SSIG_01575 [Streptomyces filamentosus NRRL 11379]